MWSLPSAPRLSLLDLPRLCSQAWPSLLLRWKLRGILECEVRPSLISFPCVYSTYPRYFYGLLFYTLLSLAYTNLISLEYLIKTTLLNPFQVLVSFLGPIPAAIAGFLHEDFLILFVSTLSLIALGYTCYLVLLHSGSFASGITLTEKNREKGW